MQTSTLDDNLIVRVTLVDTRDGRELWGDRFVRPMSEVIELEDMITSDIAAALQLELPAHPARLSGRDSVDPVAYQHYLQGRFMAGGSTAAQSAIALNPDLAEAHAALASIRMFFDADWPGAEVEFKKAISLGPSTSIAYYRYANLLTGLTRFDQAIEMTESALHIDPLAISALHAAGLAKLFKGDFEGAVEVFGTAIELRPAWPWPYVKREIVISTPWTETIMSAPHRTLLPLDRPFRL